jgi:hypothetical protein
MNDDAVTLFAGYLHQRAVRGELVPAGQFHASKDGTTSLCERTLVGKVYPWNEQPSIKRVCMICRPRVHALGVPW